VVRAHHGLVVVVHDDGAGQSLSFELSLKTVRVVLRRAGQATELARADVPLPGRGGLVLLKRLPQGWAVAYDATTVLRQQADLPAGGRWGVVGAPAAVLDEIMMQPTDEIQFSDDFMRLPDQPSAWEDLSGQWRIAQLESARFSANAFTLLGSATGPQPALTTAGYWFWEDLTLEASVQPSPQASGFGIGLASQSAGEVYLLRFISQARPAGLVQLVQVGGGRERILAAAPAVVSPDDWHRLALSGVAGRLTGALNGVELLAAEVPALAQGKVALWVTGPQPVAFDDIDVYCGPRAATRPVVLSHEAQSADPGAQAFIRDQYMQQWADERDQWLLGSGGVWHAGYFWGEVALSWELPESGLSSPARLQICVPAGADTLRAPAGGEAGCQLELAPAADGQLTFTLREGSQVRAQKTVPLPQPPGAVILRRAGDTIEALLGGAVVASYTTTLPAAGKVGLTTSNARRQTGRLGIISPQVIDSTFRSSPTDWTIGSGEWGVSSRWACSPRWSWFQGRSPDLASVWTRKPFAGDVVVEFFAGLTMDQPWAPFYQHPGNLAVTLGGADGTPGSGYSLVFAGWGNSAAGIFRRGELVAQVPGFVMPDILDSLGGTTSREDPHKLHNEWQRLRAERIGSTVRLLVNGKLAVSYTDPDPLPGGAVGIWTLDQAMTVARARIYYEKASLTLPPVKPVASAAARPGLALPRFGPPRVVSTFDQGLSGWQPATPGACAVALARREASGDNLCLEITNPTAGGSFALAAPVAGLNLREHSLLAFDYALPAAVQVDLFATVAGQRYRVVLTGPPDPVPGIEDVGRLTGAQADGRWRSAQLDLLGLLSPHFPPQAPIILEALQFAAPAAPQYLRAGIGGNPAGATWQLDNVYLGGVTAGSVSLTAGREVSVTAAGAHLAPSPRGGNIQYRLSPQQSGLAAVTLAAGGRSTTDLVAFDTHPPVLAPRQPAPGANWLGPLLTVTLSDTGPAGIDEQSLAVQLDEQRFTVADPALQWHPAAGQLTLDLRQTAGALTPGRPVTVRVQAADRAGNQAAPLQFVFTPDVKTDTTPPPPPRLTGTPAALLDCDFETDLGTLQPWGVAAGVALRRARNPVVGNPAGGQWCLEACATKLGGLFGVSLGVAPFDATRYPVLEFDYRVTQELRVDLIIEVNGRRRVIKFTDNDQTWPVIGRVGAVADNRWHRATLDLYGMLRGSLGRSGPLVVTELAFASSGWPGNRNHTRWWLDNVRLQAALQAADLPADLAWQARDESGIAGWAWGVSLTPGTEPPAQPVTGELRAALSPHAGALVWLRGVAVDGAGNRSAVATEALRLMSSDDREPPVASAPTPADGATACPATISVKVTDAGSGVSPADLRLTINGRTWSVAEEALSWDTATGQLTWSLPAGVSLGASGARVQCRLVATDLAGKAMMPLEWAFTLNYQLADQPPAAPVVSYVPARWADHNDFETHTGGWGNFLDAQVLRRAEGGASGPGCIELRDLAAQGRGQSFVLMRDFSEGWREFSRVRFRYRVQNAPGASLQLYGTTFDGAGDRWTPLATFPVSGREWLSAEVDIVEVLGRNSPSLDIHRIFLSVSLPPDGVLLVDDYAMYSPAADRATFRWAPPPSPSGLTGYSWVLDTAADTVPPEKSLGTALETEFKGLAPGRYVFHLRARNGAGQWGATSHVPIELTAPAKADH
jgi:hypothetical protein